MAQLSSNIQQAVQQLSAGKPVALPTETVYGLAANAQNIQAVEAVFALKKRPLTHPLIMHVAPEWDLTRWCHSLPDYVPDLVKSFWPGPLTLVLECLPDQVPALIRGGQSSVAIRSPNHPLFLECLRELACPLVAPSANPFGKISPTSAQHVLDSFPESNLLVLEGGRCPIGIESTIIDARAEHGFRILRPGLIQPAIIERAAGVPNLGEPGKMKVSGNLPDHYQPEKPLFAYRSDCEREDLLNQYDQCLFVIDHHLPAGANAELFFQWPSSAEVAAYELYFQLRVADCSPAAAIAVRLPEKCPEWAAICERIEKARTKTGS